MIEGEVSTRHRLLPALQVYLPRRRRPSPPMSSPAMTGDGLVRLQHLVNCAADELQMRRPPVRVVLTDNKPAGQAGGGRRGAHVRVSPGLVEADEQVQRWFAGHEVGHLRSGTDRPVRTALTSIAAFKLALLVVVVAAAVAMWWLRASPWGLSVLPVWGLVVFGALALWAALSRAEEYTADGLAARVLSAAGLDPVQHSRQVMELPWFTDPGDRVLSMHPSTARRLAALQQAPSA